MLTRLLLAAAGCAALCCAAAAADLPRPAPPAPPPAAPFFTWTGFYAGGNAGYASGFSGASGVTGAFAPYLGGGPAFGLSGTSEGFTGGGQLGFNYQFGQGSGVVVGVESDIAYADLSQRTTLAGPRGAGLTAAFHTSLDAIGTVRARAGYGFGPLLVYGTGGFAYGVSDRQSTLTGPGGATALRVDMRDLDMGYAVGGGVEYALPIALAPGFLRGGAVTVRAEYLHVDLGQDAVPLLVGNQVFTTHLRAAADIGRAGINYKF